MTKEKDLFFFRFKRKVDVIMFCVQIVSGKTCSGFSNNTKMP